MSDKTVINPINLNLNVRSSNKTSSDINSSVNGASKEDKILVISINKVQPSYFHPSERVSIRTFFFNYCIFIPVLFDLTFSRHRSTIAALCIYLQLILSILFLIYSNIASLEDLPELFEMSSCASVQRKTSIADNILYIPYLVISLTAISRFQVPFWLLIAAPISIIYLGVLSAYELPNCIEILNMPVGVLPTKTFSLLHTNLTIGTYGIFRWITTVVITFEFVRLARMLLYDIIWNNARPKCILDFGTSNTIVMNDNISIQVTTHPSTIEEWGTNNSGSSISETNTNINNNTDNKSEETVSYVSKINTLYKILKDIASRPYDIPIRHAIAISITCLMLLFIATTIAGWCETIRILLITINEEANSSIVNIFRDVVTYLPYGAWVITGFFWLINIYSIYEVSEHHRQLVQKYKLEKEGISNGNMDAILEAKRIPKLLNFVIVDASTYIVAYLFCNLISYAITSSVLIGLIIINIVLIGWNELLAILLSIFSLPFIISLLRKCMPRLILIFINMCFKFCIKNINIRCSNSKNCMCQTLEDTIRCSMGMTCCMFESCIDGQFVLAPRCLMMTDCISTLLISPFMGFAIATTRCMYGSLWGIIALSQLHKSILPTFLESNDYPYQYYGGMMRASHQELIDEENDSIPSIERKEEWR